ncbi:MAG: gliding motility-associated C-terminal domain-containing protein [Saprospiraceae bacterium]|nr:gliding motility-associated C-terminal domain-containing protein [Saprospiraceae bacterium]
MVSIIPETCLLRQGLLTLVLLLVAFCAQSQDCDCLNCPQALPPPGLDSCQTLEFILNIKGAENDDLAHPFQGVCGLQVHFQHNYVWSLSMCLISPGGDTIELIGPSMTSGFASSAFSSWNISFVQSSILPNPDPGKFGQWTNNQLWAAFESYTGSYHPYKGNLEDFDSGPVNGQWKILVKNCTELEKGTFINFSILFCDDSGIDCSCQAYAGKLNKNQNLSFCEHDPGLALDLKPVFLAPQPDTADYGYTFIQSSNGVIEKYIDTVDLTGALPGLYQICGLSYLKKDLDSIPAPDGLLSVSALRESLFSDAPPFCGDITNNCLNILIAAPPPLQVIDTILCAGKCYPLGGNLYCESISVTDTFPTITGCDSIVTLNLIVQNADVIHLTDTICDGEFKIVGTNFYNKTGQFRDTLISPFTGCDSIVQLDLVVINIEAHAVAQGILDCTTPTVGISGVSSLFNYQNPLIQWIPGPGGQVVGGQQTLFALVNQPAVYTLKLSVTLASGKVCSDSAAVTVMANPEIPDLKGPSKVAYCEGSIVNLNQAGFSDMSQLGGQLSFHDDMPLDTSTQIGPMVDPTQVDTVFVFYRYGNCTDTLSFTWTEIPAPAAAVKSTIHICNSDGGGIFNTLVNFDTLITNANVVGSWSNTDGAPVGGIFSILDFSGVPGPVSYTFTWTSLNATAPCANITRFIEIFVENCACPSVATIPPGPFCTTDPGVHLQNFELTQEPGSWSLTQVPSGSNPAQIFQDSLVVTAKDTGDYMLVFKLTNAPPPGCPDSTAHLVSVHAPPVLQLAASDTVCNQMANGQWPTTIHLDSLILFGPPNGVWLEIDASGASGAIPSLDFTGVPPGKYTYQYTTSAAQMPCPEAVGTTEVVVVNCLCPPLEVSALDTVCNDVNAVQLADFEINVASGLWSLAQAPSGIKPAIILGNQLQVVGSDTGHYTLVYSLIPPPPASCPQTDTLDLVLLSPRIAFTPISDTVCNVGPNGNWPATLNFQSLILSGDTTGLWSALTPVPGVTGMLPYLDFTGATPGSYIFSYVFRDGPPPCLVQSYSTIIHVIDCSCPTVDDITLCNDEPDLDLATLLPPGTVAGWVIVTGPPGMNAASLSGQTLTTQHATPGVYYLKASWTNPPGDPCPDEAIVEVHLEALPQVDLQSTISVCNESGPFGSPLLWLDSLFVLPPSSGVWVDADNSGASGVIPFLDFTGVTAGTYTFVYQTTLTSTACPNKADTLFVEVVECTCPTLSLSGQSQWCTSSGVVQLDPYNQFPDPGIWTLVATPAGSSPGTLSGSLFDILSADPGIYTFRFTMALPPPPGCPDTAFLSLEIAVQPEAGMSIDSLYFCPGVPVNLDLFNSLVGYDAGGQWGVVSSNPSPIATIQPTTGQWFGNAPSVPGNYQLFYLVPAASPCQGDTALLALQVVDLPVADAGPDQVLGCTSNQVILGSPGGNTQPPWLYVWTLGMDTISSMKEPEVALPGLYILAVYDQETTCFATDTVSVVQGQTGPTSMQVSLTQPSCQAQDGEILINSVTGGVGPYLYSINQLPLGMSNVFAGLGPGANTIHLEDAQGCPLDSIVVLQDATSFTIDLGPDLTVPPGTVLNLEGILSGTPGSITSVSWQPMNIICPTCLIQTVEITETVQIDIQVENQDGCIATDQVLITVNDGPVRYFIPTVFSPNGDGINDGFTIYGNELISRISELSIYDRWGTLLFQRTDLSPGIVSEGWDGKYRGELLDPAVFIYSATIRMTNGQERLIKGEIQLIR